MSIPCNRPNCLCSHNECDNGWIFFRYKNIEKRTFKGETIEIENEYDGVTPCEGCDPERAQIFKTAKSPEDRDSRLRARSSLLNSQNSDNYEASRTRTL